MVNDVVNLRAEEILSRELSTIYRQTDRLFAVLFVAQWAFAVLCALVVTPRTWVGPASYLHIHVGAALVMGGLLSALPISLALLQPGRTSTRMIIAVAQMLYSGLLIHLTSGRIETHFHVFGSLAFLAFYRDWRVFIPATLVVAADHFLRGLFWPQSVFGVIVAAPWRAFEHAGWVLFEDVFLTWGCISAVRDLRAIATSQAKLEAMNHSIEDKVRERTAQLLAETKAREAESGRREQLESQLLQARKMESIGQLAAGIAHEINTPMQFVKDNIEYLSESLDKLFALMGCYERNLNDRGPQKSWQERTIEINEQLRLVRYEDICREIPQAILESTEGIYRVIDIVKAMKEFTHPGHDEKEDVDLNASVQACVTITRNRWKSIAELQLDLDPYLPPIQSVPAEISQVLLNLIVNAADAIADKNEANSGQFGTISIRTLFQPGSVTVEVADTGCGIPDEVRQRIFDPFFTTKEVGKGTGQGLTICYGIIVQKLGGTIDVESVPGIGTRFIVRIPAEDSPSLVRGKEPPILADEPEDDASFETAIPAFAD